MTYSPGAVSVFPQGFPYGAIVRGVPLLQAQPGQVFWLNNSSILNPQQHAGSDSNHGTYLDPFATIENATNFVVPGRGDIIMIGAGHAETISNATATILNSSGAAVIGLGSGPYRPTFTLNTATGASLPITGSNLVLQNLLFIANFANIASYFTQSVASVTASLSGTTLTVTVVGSGTLYPGSYLSATGILANTCILNQVSGTTGGVGVYTVNNSQTIASTTFTTLTQDVSIDNCEFRDTSSILNALSVWTDAGVANSMSGFSFTRNVISSLGTTAATTAIKITA